MKQIKTLTALFAVFFLWGISPQVCASHAMAQLLLAEEGTECDHSYSYGFCTLCGEPQADYVVPGTDGYYNLANAHEFLWWSKAVASGTTNASARLTADIDMEGIAMVPVGATEQAPFRGTFDGQGHVIRNLELTGENKIGLFSYVTGGAYVKNFILDSSCSISGGSYVGTIGCTIGNGSVNIEGIGMEGTVTASSVNAGGILGCRLDNTAILMSDCYVTGKVIGGSESAAMAGWVGSGAKLTNLWACGEVQGQQGDSYLFRGSTTIFDNCYAISGNQGKLITEEQLADGSLAFMLNKGVVENPVWRQSIGDDVYPVLDRSHGIVLQVSAAEYRSITSEQDISSLASAISQSVSEYCTNTVAEKALLDAYVSKAEALAACGTVQEFCAAYALMRADLKAIEASVAVYARYVAKCAEISKYFEENDYLVGEGVENLKAYLESDDAPSDEWPLGGYLYVTEQHVATSEQIEAEIERLNQQFEAALAGSYVAGQDITDLLINADFSQSPEWTGWDGVTGSGMQTVTALDGKEYVGAESWQKVMDMHQTVKGLRPGYYLVSMNGAYRHHNDRYSNAYFAQLYAGTNNIYLPTVYETRIGAEEAVDDQNCNISGEGTTDLPIYANGGTVSEEAPIAYALHGMPGMAYAIASGRALNHIIAYVGQEGQLTIGVRREDNGSTGNWMGFGNFRLTYCGDAGTTYTEEAVTKVLEEQNSRATTILELYQVDDITPEAAPNYPATIKAALQQAKAQADAAATVEEKMACIARYSELFNQLNEGKVAYLSLFNTAALLESAGTALEGKLTQSQYDEILDASKTLYEAYTDGTYSTEEALHPALLESEVIRNYIPNIDANGVIHIASLNNWVFFSAYVNGGKTTAVGKLEADIEGVTEDMVIKDFRGTLDGDYHTMTLNINHPAERAGLIETLGGTIKNLYLQGTVTTEGKYAGGVAGAGGNSGVNIQNVVCKVDIVSGVDGDGTHGGMIGYSNVALNITNSMFAGSISGEKTHSCGGFVGWLDAGLTVKNCLMLGNITVNPNGGHTWARNTGHMTLTNSYYLNAHSTASGTQVTAQQLASGEVCHWLNEESNANLTWYQTLGEDAIPVPDPSHKPLGITYEGTYTNDVNKFAVEHTGTKDDPYVLATATDMERLRSKMRMGEITYFVLNNDIDMSSISWVPINGNGNDYNGRGWARWIDLDGKGHVLRNLKCNDPGYGSFFGVLCGNVRNIGFEDAEVNCAGTGSGILGGYAGHTDYSDADRNMYTCYVENVWVTGKLYVGTGYCGGLFGNIGGPTVIRNCYANLEIKSDASLNGGLIGRVRDALTLENCYAAGSISAGTWGGIVGGGQKGTTPGTIYKNIVVWNNTEKNFGSTTANDKLSGILYYDGSNFHELQQSVVAWDSNLWTCTMEDGAYPVLLQTAIGIKPVTDEVVSGTASSGIYTLTGVRVQKPGKGLYIINGRKVLVK